MLALDRPLAGLHRIARSPFARTGWIAVVAIGCLLMGTGVGADVPETMTFQGLLRDGDTPLTGTAHLTFALYPDSTGGSPLWTHDAGSIEVDQGLYSVTLGPLTGLAFDQAYWLQVTVDGTVLTPRYPLHSVPYALRASAAATADRATTADVASAVADDAIDGAAVADGSLTADDLAVDVLSGLAGVTHDGGEIALVAGENVTITADDLNNRITISATGSAGDVSDVFGGDGLLVSNSGGPEVTLAVGTGTGLETTEDLVQLTAPYVSGTAYDDRFVNESQPDAISAAMIAPSIISSLSGVSNDGGNISLLAGENVAIEADDTANTITISASGGEGAVTTVYGGSGLKAINPGGPVTTLGVGAGDGIAVDADAVSVAAGDGLTFDDGALTLTSAYLLGSAYDERFVLAGDTDAISLDMLAPDVIGSVDGVSNDGGDVDFVGGTNMSITASDETNSVTFNVVDVVTDVLAGDGIAVSDPSGPQATVSVVVGDGLQILEDGIIVDPAAIAGPGLRRDGNNDLMADLGDGLDIYDDEIAVDAEAIAGEGLRKDSDHIVGVRPGSGIMITADSVVVDAAAISGAGLQPETDNIVGIATGKGTAIAHDQIVVDAAEIAGKGLYAEDDNVVGIDPGTGLQIDGDEVELTDAYSSGSAYDSRFVNEGGPGTIPIGGIIAWYGSIGSIPSGWALCDDSSVGGHTTPDLRGRFILAAGSGGGLTPRTPGQWGGEERHQLSVSELPSHSHGVSDPGHSHSYTDPLIGQYTGLEHDENGTAVEYPYGNWGTTTESTTGISINSTGSNSPHNNMPPFYVLAYIMRVQ